MSNLFFKNVLSSYSINRVTPSTGYPVDGVNREQKVGPLSNAGQAQGYADA